MGVEMLRDKVERTADLTGEPFPPELLLRLKHMIVSHHGTHEFGSPKLPMTLEAIALHYTSDKPLTPSSTPSAARSATTRVANRAGRRSSRASAGGCSRASYAGGGEGGGEGRSAGGPGSGRTLARTMEDRS